MGEPAAWYPLRPPDRIWLTNILCFHGINIVDESLMVVLSVVKRSYESESARETLRELKIKITVYKNSWKKNLFSFQKDDQTSEYDLLDWRLSPGKP